MPSRFPATRWLGIIGASAAIWACSSSITGSVSPTYVLHGSASAPPAGAPSASAGAPTFSLAAGPQVGVGGAASFPLDVYSLYISASPDCSNPVMVEDHGATAVVKDMIANPELFSGSPAAGTYHCLILKMSDSLTFTSAVNSGNCSTGVIYHGDIYRAGDSSWKDMDGNPVVGHGEDSLPVNDHVTLFLTTDTSAVEAALGADHGQTLPISGALSVPGSGTLYWDMTQSVSDDGTNCGLEPPTLAFR